MLPTGSRMPYGNRFYHPIWEACERHGLVIGIHPGNEGAGMAGPPTGVGYPTYYIETRMARPQMAMAHAVSFIAEGVFEKFPGLKVLIDECDQFWAVGLMWHMDADWKSLRDQTPWLKRLPSEYFRGHIRVGTQPMLEPETNEPVLDDAGRAARRRDACLFVRLAALGLGRPSDHLSEIAGAVAPPRLRRQRARAVWALGTSDAWLTTRGASSSGRSRNCRPASARSSCRFGDAPGSASST